MANPVAEITAPAARAAAPRGEEAAQESILQVRLRTMTWEAAGVLSLEFQSPLGGSLPAFAPGAHIDLHLPDGTLRQYSLCGDSNDLSHYRIAVRSITGGIASQFIH